LVVSDNGIPKHELQDLLRDFHFMQFKDYYEVLGVKPDATDAAIKSAYRRLARKFHPDVSKVEGAEEKFKGANEAYEALKDPAKRKAYDQLRARGYRPGEEFNPPPNFNDGQGFSGHGGENEGFSDFFESLFGNAGGARGRRPAGPRRGQDVRARVQIDLVTAYQGGKQRLTLRDQGGSERALEIKIPAGILSGQQIRLAGQGSPGAQGGPAGDLLLEVELLPDALFELDGRNVLLQLPITPWEAALGASVAVPTLAGNVDLKVPAGSNSGRKLRLKGRGLPGSPAGDQLVTLVIHAPVPSTDAQRKVYEDMAREFDFDPRQPAI